MLLNILCTVLPENLDVGWSIPLSLPTPMPMCTVLL